MPSKYKVSVLIDPKVVVLSSVLLELQDLWMLFRSRLVGARYLFFEICDRFGSWVTPYGCG